MVSEPTYKTVATENSFAELFRILWLRKWIIVIVVVTSTSLAVLYSLSLPNIYKSEAQLAPASEEQASGLAGLAGQFGGLASLAGVNLNEQSSGKVLLAIEVLKSRDFITNFIQKHDILLDLMAAESWDFSTDQILYDPTIYSVELKQWVREVNPPLKPKPSLQEAYKQFRNITSVHQDEDTGMIFISIKHPSPNVAKQWVELLIEDINATMKERDVMEANRSIKYLTEQINTTTIADIKTVLYKLVEEQAKTIMFAEVRDEYVFKTIDSPISPEKKSGPKRALICLFGLCFGLMLGVFISLSLHFLRTTEHKSN